jgi:hypothetical protein
MSRLRQRGGERDAGAAIVEYVLVSTLLLFVTFGVIQIALVLHARNVLVADAAEGARAASVRDAQLSDGETVCSELVRHSLSVVVQTANPPCRGSFVASAGGLPNLVRMEVDATVGLTFVPGGRVHLHAAGRAVREPQ